MFKRCWNEEKQKCFEGEKRRDSIVALQRQKRCLNCVWRVTKKVVSTVKKEVFPQCNNKNNNNSIFISTQYNTIILSNIYYKDIEE